MQSHKDQGKGNADCEADCTRNRKYTSKEKEAPDRNLITKCTLSQIERNGPQGNQSAPQLAAHSTEFL
jgi:hypothetical protein